MKTSPPSTNGVSGVRVALHVLIWSAILTFAILTFWPDGAGGGREGYPNRPVKVIVPFGAGGSSDTFVRVIQKAISDGKMLGQPLVILNQGGGSGTIGSRSVKDAAPDGYTLLNLHESMMTAQASGKVPYGPEAFEAIAATGRSPLVVIVRADSGYSDLEKLLAAARERPETIGFGTNIGSPSHYAGLLLEHASQGARFRYIQIGGGQKRYTSLIGGHIEVGVFSLDELMNYRSDGKIRALALLDEKRSVSTPDLPTARELGVDVVYSNTQYWWAPKGTPSDRVEAIGDVLERAMGTEEVRERLAAMNFEPIVVRGEALRGRLENRAAMLRKIRIPESADLPNFPLYVIGVVVLLGLWVTVDTLRNRTATVAPASSAPDRPGLVAGLAALSLAYVILLQLRWVRFSIVTLLFILGAAVLLGERSKHRWLGVTELACLFGFGLEFVFTRVLVIDLP